VPFIHPRTVRFQDTDAAGVVYFANVLAMCHEAYEALLATSGINVKTFFSGSDFAVPIVHAEVDFSKPMFCGDRIEIHLTVTSLQTTEFEIEYRLFTPGQTEKPLSYAVTRHVCIDAMTRSRRPLPDSLLMALHPFVDELKSASSPADD